MMSLKNPKIEGQTTLWTQEKEQEDFEDTKGVIRIRI